jgi:hypothetical protein
MKEKKENFKKITDCDNTEVNLLYEKVKWTEGGITHLGTVMEISTIKGEKYLTVMTIFAKKHTVKMSKVKCYSEQFRPKIFGNN